MGAWTNINDGESGSSVRYKINTAFNFLFGWIDDPPPEEDQSRWEMSGTADIQPKDEMGVIAPRLNAASNFRVEADGKVFIDNLAEAVTLPVLVGTDGRLRTAATVDTYTLTINVTTVGIHEPISGSVWITGSGYTGSIPFTGGQAVIEGLPDGVYQFSILTENYLPYMGEATISGANQIIAAQLSLGFSMPDEVVGGRKGIRINSGVASNLELSNPVAVVERSVNYELALPDADAAQTVEMSARKSTTGGALTLVANGGFLMDGESGDVLTTTVKGAWVKVKSIDIDGTDTWVVIQDSGDWQVDTI